MRSVAELLKMKAAGIYAISPDASVLDCVQMLADKGIGAVLVMEGETLLGILSERDYARKVMLQGKSSKDTKAREIMTAEVLTVTPHATNEECMALMTNRRLRHLPVVDNGKVVGMISIGDVVRDLIAEQQFVIGQLERYINS